MDNQYFGQYTILRPCKHIEKKVRAEIESYLFQNYKPGIYNNCEEINNIIKLLMDFYSKKLDKNLNEIASIDLLETILKQYDITCEIDKLKKNSKLNNLELEKWNSLNCTRRALKYISEKIVMINPSIKSIKKNNINYSEILSELIIAAEELISLYLQSDSTFKIFPNESELILRKNEPIYWELKVNHWYNPNEMNNLQNNWLKLNTDGKINFDSNLINSHLQKGLNEKFGVSFNTIMSILANIIHYSEGVNFIEKDDIIADITYNYNITKDIAENILSGFTITSINLIEENRQVYLPKQEYRLLYRGFLEVNYNQKKYLLWSKNMANENLSLLLRDINYKKFPIEWKSSLIEKSIEHITNELGSKFEHLVNKRLKDLEIIGDINFKKIIGTKKDFIKIPTEVGEIDFLGINLNTKELIVGECKMIAPALEPKSFYADIRKFTDSKKGYLLKFEKKVKFISDNKEKVIECLTKQLNLSLDKKILSQLNQRNIMFTYYPCIMKAFIKDFELFDLYEFIAKYNTGKS